MLNDTQKKRLKFLFVKMPIFIGLFCLVMILALKLVERYPDPLKEGFEKYLSETTNTKTTVERLEKAAFFPNIDIRLHNMTMHRADNAAIIDMEAKKFFVSVPLSGLFIREGKFNLLDIENFKANDEVFTPFAFEIENAKIIDKEGPEQYGSFLIAKGKYAKKKMRFEAQINKEEKGYSIPNELSVSISLDQYELNATTQQRDGNIILTNTTFDKGNKKSPAKEYVFVEKGVYTKNNPLACLYLHAGDDIKQCDQYLE